jgi:hypothetical protein
MTSAEVRDRLNQMRASASAQEALTFLSEKVDHPVGQMPATVTASEALRLWRTRLGNTAITGAPLLGAEDLIRGLEKLAPQSKVDQFAFAGKTAALTVFFTRTSGSYIGAAMLDKRDAVRRP